MMTKLGNEIADASMSTMTNVENGKIFRGLVLSTFLPYKISPL